MKKTRHVRSVEILAPKNRPRLRSAFFMFDLPIIENVVKLRLPCNCLLHLE